MKLTILYFSDAITSAFSNKSILLISMGITPFITAITGFMKIKFLGFTVAMLIFLSLLIILDLFTGIIASKFEGKKLTSSRGLRSVHKFISYFMFLCFVSLLQGQLDDSGHSLGILFISQMRILIFVQISLWEWHSIGENYERRFGYKPKIFQLLDKLGEMLEKRIAKKMEESDLCPTLKPEDKNKQSGDKLD